jgi:hypothetical protein
MEDQIGAEGIEKLCKQLKLVSGPAFCLQQVASG